MKVVFLEPLGIPMEQLRQMAGNRLGESAELVFYDTRSEDADTLVRRSREADVVVLSNLPYPKEVMGMCERLKMVCVAFTGVDHVDVAYCREKGITVCNCAGYSTVAVAELVMGLVIALARHVVECNDVVRTGGTKEGLVGWELAGKKFGVIGAGAIGLRVARLAAAFGCEVYAYSRTVKDVDGVRFVALDTLLLQCDIVSLHVPLTADTVGLMGKEQFSRMKKTAVLINTSRGPVVDSQALYEALAKGDIAGAAVDVFEMEPPIPENHVLFGAPNLLAAPHVAFATAQSMEKRAVMVMDNLAAYLAGRPVNVVK